MKKKRSLKSSFLCAVAPLIVAGCAQEQAAMRTRPPIPESPAKAQAAETERDAGKILKNMAEFLAKTPRFSVNLADSYDVLQESGQKIEFGETRKIVVNRPNGLSIDVEHSDGEKHLVLYDGKAITVYSPKENVYAQVAKDGGIDEAVTYFLRDLHMRLPLAALLLSRFPAEIESRTQELEYVETNVINGKPVHHLAGRTETVDYQLWIPAGARPLPLRAVLTYRNEQGQPEFRADFSDWNLAPDIQDNQFAFNPPEGSRKIAFAAELPQVSVEGAAQPTLSGERK